MVKEEVLEVTPRASERLGGGGTLGIRLSPNVARVEAERPSGAAQLVGLTNGEFARIYTDVFGGVSKFAGSLLPGAGGGGGAGGKKGGGSGGAELSGPIGVVKMGAEIAGSDSSVLLNFAAAISINLAVINSLPLPALDGGQLAFIVVEVLRRGRKLDVRVEEAITSLAFLVLGLVSVNAAIGDVWTNLLSLK